MYRTALLTLVVLAGSSPAQGQLDLLPAESLGGVVIRNLDDLKQKGDQFIKDTELRIPLRPTELFNEAYKFLGVQAPGVVDRDGSAAIVLASPKVIGQGLSLNNLDRFLVVAIPFKDIDRIGAAFGLKKGELKPDRMTEIKSERSFGRLCFVRGKHLFLGNDGKAVESVIKGKKLAAELTAGQRKGFVTADMLIHLGTDAWGEAWKSFLSSTGKAIAGQGEEPERKAASELLDALASVRFALGAVRIDGGLGLNIVTAFPKDGKGKASKFLTDLRAGDRASTLRGLPVGNVIAAQAASGDGTRNMLIARVLFRFFLEHLLETTKVLHAADRPTFVGVFAEVWQRLQGSRFALYKTSNERKLGLLAIAGILDNGDPEKFLKELKQLARFATDGLALAPDTGKEADRAEVERLVGNLGNRRFATRESATTRLLLIGDPALPFLKKAAQSTDLEMARRADRIRREILAAAEARRKEILGKDLTRGIRPSFAFQSSSEKIDGHPVTVLAVRLRKKDAAAVPQLRQLLGPDWNRIRLLVHGKHVAILVGSDVALLRETLKNLKEDRPGLAAAPALKEYHKRVEAGRKLEFHASLQAAAALLRAADLAKPGAFRPGETFSSVALSVEPDRVQLDVWVPSKEFKGIAKAGGW
jgi:hypothetical protein